MKAYILIIAILYVLQADLGYSQINGDSYERFCNQSLTKINEIHRLNESNQNYLQDQYDNIHAYNNSLRDYLDLLQISYDELNDFKQSRLNNRYLKPKSDETSDFLNVYDKYSPEEKSLLLNYIEKWQSLPQIECEGNLIKYNEYSQKIEEAYRTLKEIEAYKSEAELLNIAGFLGIVTSKAVLSYVEKNYFYSFMLFAETEEWLNGRLPSNADKIMQHAYRFGKLKVQENGTSSDSEILATFLGGVNLSASIARFPMINKILTHSFVYPEIVNFYFEYSHININYNSAAKSIIGNIRHMAEQRLKVGALYIRCTMDDDYLEKVKRKLNSNANNDYSSSPRNALIVQQGIFETINKIITSIRDVSYNNYTDISDEEKALKFKQNTLKEAQSSLNELINKTISLPFDESRNCNIEIYQDYMQELNTFINAILDLKLPDEVIQSDDDLTEEENGIESLESDLSSNFDDLAKENAIEGDDLNKMLNEHSQHPDQISKEIDKSLEKGTDINEFLADGPDNEYTENIEKRENRGWNRDEYEKNQQKALNEIRRNDEKLYAEHLKSRPMYTDCAYANIAELNKIYKTIKSAEYWRNQKVDLPDNWYTFEQRIGFVKERKEKLERNIQQNLKHGYIGPDCIKKLRKMAKDDNEAYLLIRKYTDCSKSIIWIN